MKEKEKIRKQNKNKWCRGNQSPPHPEVDWCPASLTEMTILERPNHHFFIVEHGVTWCGISLWSIQLRVVLAVFPLFLVSISSLLAGVENENQGKPWCYASTIQQKLKHRCIINTALAKTPKYSTIWATVKKVNSIPARSCTPFFLCTAFSSMLLKYPLCVKPQRTFHFQDACRSYIHCFWVSRAL